MIVREIELRHYGVKGMKWGHRKNKYGENGSKNREIIERFNGLR